MAKAVDRGNERTYEIKELKNRSTEYLRSVWVITFKRPLPPNPRREFLIGSLSYELQARREGGLGSRALHSLHQLAKDLAKGLTQQSEARAIRPGTRLLRTWQGETHEILALEKGFSYRGETYSSLSEIARLITGSRWSGPLFLDSRRHDQSGWGQVRGRVPDMATETKRPLRCAIYTRKSSEEGLEQSFNSLDAQREACLSYVQSQKHEGWKALSTHYDDGGFSGGTLVRPAMTKLLEDISAGKVDLVVVYKVDRLTRSLADFAKIVEAFDAKGVSFVSVTQSFNTSTSMGRLTLNVLLSFAQFEREVTGERIRDKIAASKKKGMWMGGMVPFGYDLEDRKLVVNEREAASVRRVFELYLERKSVPALKVALDEEGIRTKVRTGTQGKRMGGQPWFRGALYQLLQNPIYLGEIRHRKQRYPGEHEAIVSREVWEETQRLLADNSARETRKEGAKSPSLLVGCVVDDQGNRMIPSHTQRHNRRYRYYMAVSPTLSQDGVSKGGLRVPAHDLEEGVWARLKRFLSSPTELLNALGDVGGRQAQVVQAAAKVVDEWVSQTAGVRREWLKAFLLRVVVSPSSLTLDVDPKALRSLVGLAKTENPSESITLSEDVHFKRGGRGLRFVIPGVNCDGRDAQVDKPLIQAVARGRYWYDLLLSGQAKSREEIAKVFGISGQHVARLLPLAWLTPDIVEAILEGRQPKALTVKRLLAKLPMDWSEQRRVLGFAPKALAS